MPINDWSRIEAGLFNDFHHAWIAELSRSLNSKLLSPDYYALAEQHAGSSHSHLPTLQGTMFTNPGEGHIALAEPKLAVAGETEMEFYRRKQATVTVRHVSGDRVVAMIEVVAVGDQLSDMPLFLAPRACVEVPLEETYQSAFAAFPRRWRHVLEQANP